MNGALLERLSSVIEEKRSILCRETRIDRSIYMDGSRDVGYLLPVCRRYYQ